MRDVGVGFWGPDEAGEMGVDVDVDVGAETGLADSLWTETFFWVDTC